MNRRDFIRHTSLTAAGGLLGQGLPVWASALPATSKHVVLAIVAGISREDFGELFSSTFPESSGLAEQRLFPMRYNGRAAGHRLALESILQGRYISETETGKTVLTATALFTSAGAGKGKYLVTADREFLKAGAPPALTDAEHLCVGMVPGKKRGQVPALPDVFIRQAHPASAKSTVPYQAALTERLYGHGIPIQEDRLVAETARILIEKEHPLLLVAHFMGADAAHSDVHGAKENRRHIASGLQSIWEAIRKLPQPGDTLLLILPDFGRNTAPNQIPQPDGSFATDHTIAEESTKQIACFAACTKGIPAEIAGNGESIDILPTIGHHLGLERPVPLPGKNLL